MAKNKFASLLHRNTNRITVVLVYAVVEWILILLLLFTSLLFHLIIKYAEFFGVKRPCPCCTVNMHADLVCELHANQISKLGYCSIHRKLAQSQDMCLNCFGSDKCSLFPWMMGFGVIQDKKEKVGEKGEVRLKCCCCCGVRLDHSDSTVFSSYLLLQDASPWFDDVLKCIKKQDWITCGIHNQQELNSVSISDTEMKESENGAGEEEDGILQVEEKLGTVEEKETSITKEIPPQHLQFFLHYNDHDIVADHGVNNRSMSDQMEVVLDFETNVEPKLSQQEHNSLASLVDEFQEMAAAAWEMHLDDRTDIASSEEVAQIDTNENESNLEEADDQGPAQVIEEMMGFQCISKIQGRVLKLQPPFQLELNQIEDDGVTTMLASVDSLNQFHRNLAFLEKWDCGSEESADGSELEGDEGVGVTVESLKSALREERKTVHALYAELEEERSASAEAADQTMAMINRLQEEKAAMQMEAFQYQRMMEELSEFDQEALQLMNDLMVKREEEKQELEKELEVYRKKVLEYETMEKMRVPQKSSGSCRSGLSCSMNDAEDCDGLCTD